ncbi:MAG: hypothetical protein AAF658_06440, partial [Myxococcota bacterium]
IAPPESDERVLGIRYILLHELGHVLGADAGAHPPWGVVGEAQDIPLDQFPYLAISWERAPSGLVNRDGKTRPAKVRYYAGPDAKTPNEKLVSTYRWLETTSFPTLYATTSIYDDFAEAFANFVHVVMLKSPYMIELVNASGSLLRYESCWDQPRCAEKREFLSHYLEVEE